MLLNCGLHISLDVVRIFYLYFSEASVMHSKNTLYGLNIYGPYMYMALKMVRDVVILKRFIYILSSTHIKDTKPFNMVIDVITTIAIWK